MAEIRTSNADLGQIQIADEVIAIIAGTAAFEIEGVMSVGGETGKKNLSKGVRVSVKENIAEISINLLISYGYKITDVSLEVQKRVKTAVETMTGLSVSAINVHISGLHLEKK